MKRLYLIIGISFICFFLSTKSVSAATYYMDSTAGSDTNSGLTEALPWKTLPKIHGKAFLPGDVILFKKGTSWNGPLVINDSGTQAAPIRYGSYGTDSAKPVFTGVTGTTKKRAVEVLASWIVIEDIAVTDATDGGIEIFEGDLTKGTFYDNNVIRRVDFTNIGIGVTIKSSNNRVENSTFDSFRMVRNTPKDSCSTCATDDYGAIAINLNAAASFDKLGRVSISGNIITNNIIKNAQAPSNDYTVDGGFVEVFDNVDNTTISNNYVINSKGFIEIGGNRHSEIVENLFIHHNISVDNKLFSFVNVGTYGLGVLNYQVYNNVIYESSSAKTEFWFDGPDIIGPTNFLLKNNILYMRATASNKDTFLHQSNIYYRADFNATQTGVDATEIGYNLDPTEKIADAKFVDIAAKNFTLQSGSPAINAGQNVGIALDFLGKATPQGSAPDIGAYEFSEAVVTSPSPSPTPISSPSPAPTCAEDINGDKVVNLSDYSLLISNFLKTPFSPSRVDINSDGKVNLQDYSLLLQKFLKNC